MLSARQRGGGLVKRIVAQHSPRLAPDDRERATRGTASALSPELRGTLVGYKGFSLAHHGRKEGGMKHLGFLLPFLLAGCAVANDRELQTGRRRANYRSPSTEYDGREG